MQGSMSDAARNAEALFEARSVVEIREIEARTRSDIEDKKRQLRQLVGGSYRDLISSADTILSMVQSCQNVVDHVSTVQGGLAKLAARVNSQSASGQDAPLRGPSKEQLYAVGSRVKYLLDTPEVIWGCLDVGDFLEAAHRYLRAEQVHQALEGPGREEVAARFPLLQQQWPAVQMFRQQIIEQATQRLAMSARLTLEDAAAAVAACAFLQGHSSKQALQLYLDARLGWAQQFLAAAGKGSLSASSISQELTSFGNAVQDAIYQVGQLFLSPPMGPGEPVLTRKATVSDGASELLFGPLPGQQQAQTELQAWQGVVAQAHAALAALPQSEVGAACMRWLKQVEAALGQQGAGLMTSCSKAKVFAAVETAVAQGLAAWAPEHHGSAPQLAPTTPPRGTPRAPFLAVAAEAAGLPDTWEGVCDWVLAKQVAPWEQLYEAAFLQQAKRILAGIFSRIAEGFAEPLTAALSHAAQAEPAAPGAFQGQQWPGADADEPSLLEGPAARKRQKLGYSGRRRSVAQVAESAGASTGQEPAETPDWRSEVHLMHGQVDAQLQGALQAATLLAGEQDHSASAEAHMSPLASKPGTHRATHRRAAALEPSILEHASAMAHAMLTHLQQQLEGLPEAGVDVAGARTVEQALLIGRVAQILGGSPALQLVLSSPDAWHSRQSTAAQSFSAAEAQLGRPSSQWAKHDSKELTALQAKCRQVSTASYETWAAWAAAGLSLELAAALGKDPVFSATAVLKTWAETVVQQEADMGGGAVEMRFSLPAAASPAMLMLLLAACRELQRAGSFACSSTAVHLMSWELGRAIVAVLRMGLQPGGLLADCLSEKGTLQLLFDVRFAQTVLASGKPAQELRAAPIARPGQAAVAPSAAVVQQRRDMSEVEELLHSPGRLDPIDWATYEPYLWQNVATFCHRTATLFGSLTLLNKRPSGAAAKPATSTDANIMSVAPSTARFSYLPTSMPSLASSGRAASGVITKYGAMAVPSPTAGLELDDSEDYSFANLTVSRTSAGTAVDKQQAADGSGASTFEGLQNRLTTGTSERFGAFSSLLGGKAAEVTAMAQQSIGDVLPSAFPGGLSSSSLSGFTSGASGFLSSFKGLRSSTNAPASGNGNRQ